MKSIFTRVKARHCLIFALCLLGGNYIANAQSSTINTTVGSTGYIGNNGSGPNGYITFVVANTTGVAIKITEVGNWVNTSHNGTTSTLWYSSSSLSGPVSSLSAPAWTSGASGTVSGVTGTGVSTVLKNINVQVPANTTYRFALHTTGSNYYSGNGFTTTTPNHFTVSGVTMYTGDHQINGQYVGYGVSNNPRFFTGYIKFEPAAIPCADTLDSARILGVHTICPNKPYSLSIGLRSGIFLSGLSYQWQYSTDKANWSNFTGAPNIQNGGAIKDSITSEHWYRCVLTCNASNKTYTTPAHKVSISPFYYCYCDNSVDDDGGTDIGNVTIAGSGLLDTIFDKSQLVTGTGVPVYNNPNSNHTYSSYQDSLGWPCLYRDSSYVFHVSQIQAGSNFKKSVIQAYIDYNRDGLYDPNNERIFVQALDGRGVPPQVMKTTSKVPSGAKIGPTGFRIILSDDTVKTAPCGFITGQGEVEDYIVEICYRPCKGSVNAGTIISTDTSMCSGYEYRLTDTTYEKARSGFDRSWQISGDNKTWLNMPNSMNKDTLNRVFSGQPTYYRLRTICLPTHDTNYSSSTLVNAKPGYKCYCYSEATGGPELDTSDIGGVTIGTYSNNSGGPHLLNPTAVYPRTDHTDDKPIEMFEDSLYKFYIYHTMDVAEHGDAKITVFMDFDNDKEYSVSKGERIYTGYTTIGAHTLVDSVTIPLDVITDVPTGMRIVLNNDVGPNIPSDEGCGGYTSGETEDYLLIFRRKWGVNVQQVTQLTGFNVHPNPTTDGQFYVQFSTHATIKDVQVRVMNMTGQVVLTHQYQHNGGMFYKQLNIGEQPAGVYFVELQADGQRIRRKLVVQ